MIGIGTPNSQRRIPRPINHLPMSRLDAGEATPAAEARMYAGVCKEVGGCLLLPNFAHASQPGP